MATEQERAALAKSRGKEAAGMLKSGASTASVRSFVSAQGDKESEARRINRTIGKEAGFKSDPMSFKHGGTVPKTGIYKLHKGEEVIPVGENGNTASVNSSIAYQERPGRRQGATRDSANRTRRRR